MSFDILTFIRLRWHHFRLHWHFFRLHWHSLVESNKAFSLVLSLAFACFACSRLHSRVRSKRARSHVENFHLHLLFHLVAHSSRRSSFSIMNLASFSEDLNFAYLKNLVRFINPRADSQDYAMILKRTKKFKKEITNKTWIICDRERKTHTSRNQSKRHDNNKHIKCSFFIIIKLNKNIQVWMYDVKNAKHNHVFSVVDAHFAFRRMTMNEQLQNNAFADQLTWQAKWLINEDDVARQLIVKTASFRILFTLRINNSNAKKFIFKPRDIYNIKAQLRREDLESLTFIQVFMRELNRNDWMFFFQKNNHNQISHLFFFKKFSQEILKSNFEILVLDCIYKTNKYKMSLLIISEQTALHRNFYVAFCFMTRKKFDDYFWALNQLKFFYKQLELLDLIVFVTDIKKAFMSARILMFSQSNHLLCMWHISKNVLINCKKIFSINEAWKKFYKKWQ